MTKIIAGNPERAQAKKLYKDVETSEAWGLLTNAQRNERVRKFMKWWLETYFADEITDEA